MLRKLKKGKFLGRFAVERERLAADRLLAANTRATSAVAALEEVRTRLTEVQATADKEHQDRVAAEARAQSLADQLVQVGRPFPLLRSPFSAPTLGWITWRPSGWVPRNLM